MALERARAALQLLKPIAKTIPLVGGPLEGLIDVVLEGCTYVKVRSPVDSTAHVLTLLERMSSRTRRIL
jgi:hypothetical protein